MAVARDPGGAPRRVVKAKVKRSPVIAPRPEVSVQAPKVKPRRGYAPNVFTESPVRNPIEKIQTKQLRHTARAVMNAAHAQRGGADPGAFPKAPARPLTNSEAAKVLNSGIGRSVVATVPKVKVKKGGKGGKGIPLAVLADLPKELTGAGAVEAAVTRIGATSAKGWQSVPIVGHEIGNVVKDTAGIASSAVPSIYLPARDVVTGHPGKAASTLYKGVKETLKHPAEHPVSLALILRAGEGAVSRGAGELVRHSPNKALREYGSTNRTPISLGGTALETRDASKGLVENRIQKAADRRQATKQGTTVVRIAQRDGQGNLKYTAKVRALKPTERQLNGPHVLGGKLGRRIDTEAGKHNVRTRDVRGLATQTMQKAKPTTHEDAVALVNEGVIKRGNSHRPLTPDTIRQDLTAHRDQLVEHRAGLKGPAALADNAENIAQVERVLNDKQFIASAAKSLKPHFKGARAYAESLRATEPARVKYGDLTAAQVARRPLLPFAAREMGLRHKGRDDAAIRAAQRDVAVAERDLEAATKSAKPGASASAQHDVAYRGGLGAKHIMESRDLGHVRSFEIPPDRTHGAHGTHRMSRAQVAALDRRLGNHGFIRRDLANGGTRWERPAATTRAVKEAQGLFEAKARLKALKNEHTGFVTADGVPVSNQTIIDAFVRKGGNPADLAYVPARDRSGTSNFYGSGIRRPGAETKSFTGSAALAGTYPRGFDALHQHLVGSSVRVVRHQSVDNLINTFGLKQADGKYFDTKGAEAEIADMKAATGEQYVAVTAARQKVPDALMADLTPEQMQQTFHPAEPGDSHVVLFPKAVWDRLQEHENTRSRNPAQQDIQRVSQAFRHVVLLTSTKWLLGNTLENYLRMQINELTPVGVARTIAAGKKYEQDLKALGPLGEQRAAELRGAAAQGQFLSQSGSLDLFQPDNPIAKFGREFRQLALGKGKVSRQIGPNGVANLWDKYSEAVTAFNGYSEVSVYYYALGKMTRNEVSKFTNVWHKSLRKAGPAYADVVRGALDSNKIAEYARAVDDIRGRYSNLSPRGRYFVTTYTPFAPWYVNSLHFFAKTLPMHHPVKTGILAAASVGTADKRKELNLPPWAQGIPYGDGKVLPVQNFLPTGITANGLKGPTSLILPQISGLVENLRGKAWTGNDLPPGSSPLEVAANTMLGSFLPFYSRVQTVLEKGGKQQGDSTLWNPKVKDGTGKNLMAGVKKAVVPLRPQDASGGSSGGSTWGSAGGSSSSSSGWGTAGG